MLLPEILFIRLVKKYYKENSEELGHAITNGVDINKFYKEVDNGNFVNIVSEENEQLKYMEALTKEHNLNSPEELRKYMRENESEVKKELAKITNEFAKPFEDIEDPNKGNLDDYFGSGKVPSLSNPENYSTPLPGSVNGTTQILNLNLPRGASKWVYKLGKNPFNDLTLDEKLEDINQYSANLNIEVEEGDYLMLAALDGRDKLKAFSNIKIKESMINMPRVQINESKDIKARFTKSNNNSGATKIKIIEGLDDGSWKIALLKEDVEVIYEDSKFDNPRDYKENIEFILANDSELDNNLKDFKQKIIIFKERDGKIEKYNIFTLDENTVSNLLDAPNSLKVKDEKDEEKDYNYTSPLKGEDPGTSKISDLKLPDEASEWMYALVGKNYTIPKLDRIYEGSKSYQKDQDLKVDNGNYLMLLATKDKKVKAYDLIELKDSMIKASLAFHFEGTAFHSSPDKGTNVGSISFEYLNFNNSDLYYEISDDSIPLPEKNSSLNKRDAKIIERTDLNKADKIKIFDEDASELWDEKGFIKNMLIYAVNNNNEIIAYSDFKITNDIVHLPEANKLLEKNYKDKNGKSLEIGTRPNTTLLKELNKDGIKDGDNLKYLYSIVSKDDRKVEINQVLKSTKNLKAGEDLTHAKVGDYLLILLVDNENRTKYYTSLELKDEVVRGRDASRLELGMNFNSKEPKAGSSFKSTKFTSLALADIENATQFMVNISDQALTSIELNKDINQFASVYAKINDDGSLNYISNVAENKTKTDSNGNIIGVDLEKNKHLQLFATDANGKVKAYHNFILSEENIRGEEAKIIPSNNYDIRPGENPGEIKFTKLSPLGIGNKNWRYKWAKTKDDFDKDLPFKGQIINDATPIQTQPIGGDDFESRQSIKVQSLSDKNNDYGYLLLLATNDKRVLGYKIIKINNDMVQATAPILNLDLEKASSSDSTKIVASENNEDKAKELAKAKKYIFLENNINQPALNDPLPKNAKDLPRSKELIVRKGQHLRIFNVDENNKILGFKDFIIDQNHIKQAKLILEIIDHEVQDNIFEVLEGTIAGANLTLSIKLENDQWKDMSDEKIRFDILDNLKADVEKDQWNKVIEKMKNEKFSISRKNDLLTITTLLTEDYDISEDQTITLTIPPSALVDGINPIKLKEKILIKPTIDAKISGSIVNDIRQSEINSGKATINIEILDSKWIDDIGISDKKQSLLDGFNNWSLKEIIKPEHIKQLGPRTLEIEIPKNTIKYLSPENVSLRICKNLVDGAENDIVAVPAFTIYPDIIPIEGNIQGEITLEAPNYKNALKANDTWILNLENSNFKSNFSTKDLILPTLARGLKLEINKIDDRQLSIKLLGSSKDELKEDINLVVKASAIQEANYLNSKPISLPYNKGDKLDLSDLDYKIDKGLDTKGIYLDLASNDASELEYSKTSTNGLNGTWSPIANDKKLSSSLEAMSVYVREKNQKGNFKLVGKLENPTAPKDIKISKYNYIDNTLTLNKYLDLEYNLNASDKWVDVDESKIIPITKDTNLLVRKKAKEGLVKEDAILASLATPKLNGIFLGDVELDLSKGIIKNADKNMEYILSENGTPNKITKDNPEIDFKLGNKVWILDSKDDKNKKYLGEVQQSTFTEKELKEIKRILDDKDLKDKDGKDIPGIYYHIADKEIINKTSVKLEYNISKDQTPSGNWFALEDLASDVNFIAGNVFVRKVEDTNFLPSSSVLLFEIKDPIDPPSIRINPDNKNLYYENSKGTYDILDDNFEYKIGKGDYINGSAFKTEDMKAGNITVYLKKKATKNELPSKEISLNLKENIVLANVQINVAEQTIEGTSNKMEYRSNLNSPWKLANTNKTSIDNMYKGMSIWIREVNKPSNERLILDNLKQMPKPNKNNFEYNVSQKYIRNNDNMILEYKINDNSWDTLDIGESKNVNIIPSKLFIRSKASRKKLSSDLVEIISDLNFPSYPPKVNYDDNINQINSIDELDRASSWNAYEFKLENHSEWMPGENLKTFNLSGNKLIQIRKKGSKLDLASEIREILFTKNIDLSKVELRETSPLSLIRTEAEMEYQVYLKDQPNPTPWTKASSIASKLDNSINHKNITKIVLRDSRNKEISRILFVNVLDLDKVEINVRENSILNTNSQMEYSLNGQEPYKAADENITEVNRFILGEKVIIRERSIPSNYRELGIIERKDPPNVDNFDFDISKSIIKIPTLDENNNLQYRILNSDKNTSWKVLKKGDNNNIEFLPGQIQFRFVGDKDYLSSKNISSDKFIIREKESEPDLIFNDSNKNIFYKYSKGSIKKLEDSSDLEYKIANQDWKDSSAWIKDKKSPLVKHENHEIKVRKKSCEKSLASLEAVVNFTGNLSFKDVKINVLEGKIEGTKDTMEYRLDSGDWIGAGNGDTSNLVFKEGMKVFIREKKKVNNSKELTKNFKDGKIIKENKINYTKNSDSNDIEYNISKKMIKNNKRKNIEYRFNDEGNWHLIKGETQDTSVDFKAGILEVRVSSTESTLASDSIYIDIKNKASRPQLKYNPVSREIYDLVGDFDYEYKINQGDWIPASQDLVFEAGDKVKVRLKAKKYTLGSEEQVINFSNVDLLKVFYNVSESKLEKVSNKMEFSLDSNNGQDGNWSNIHIEDDVNSINIDLKNWKKIYIREKNNPNNFRLVKEGPLVKKDKEKLENIIDKINYDISQKTIYIENKNEYHNIMENLQYRISSENSNDRWVNINSPDLDGDQSSNPIILASNVSFNQGNLEFRLRADKDKLASETVFKANIKAPAKPPKLSVGFNREKYHNIIKPLDDTLEYSLGDENFHDIKNLNYEDLGNIIPKIHIRKKASKDILASESKELTFYNVVNLKIINFSTHIEAFELNGVSDRIQYKINETGLWQDCLPDNLGNSKLLRKDKSPLKSLDPVREIWIRDKKQKENIITIYKK